MTTERHASVDAVRGLAVAAMLLVNSAGDWGHVYAPLEHAAWHGFTFADWVFPCFLFVVGVSISLGVVGARDAGADPAALRRAVWVRALRIVVLGLVLHAVAYWLIGSRSFRPMGVLQRIGLCFAFAGALALDTRPRTQWAVIVALLLGYAALLAWGGPLTKEGNVASRVDAWLLGRHAYQFDPATGLGHEPEGWLSTLPAIATTLWGVRAGDWLRQRRAPLLLGSAVAGLAIGAAWSLVLPLNKELWTPSYVLWTGGISSALLWIAHLLIDRRGWPAVGRGLGQNAIAAYAGSWLLTCVLIGMKWKRPLYEQGFAWMAATVGPYVPSLAFAVANVALWWVVAAGMGRAGVRWRV